MKRTGPAGLLVALLATAPALPATLQANAGGDPGRYLVELELSARQAGARGRAELVAGARLAMTARRSATGDLTLSFERAIEAPWKLYHLDPLGPFGRQTKVAAVVTVPEASWEALDARRAAHRRFAAERYASWRPAARRKPPLDGAFAFVVIGPPEGRFNLEVDAGGGVRRVANRMTDRWLNGDFGRFVGTWGTEAVTGSEPHGYWFWNHGEKRPFRWEPGTYRALAAALEMLGGATPTSDELLERLDRVIEPLAPGAHRSAADAAPWVIEDRREVGPRGETVFESRTKNDTVVLLRRTLRQPDGGGIEADHLEVRVERPRAVLSLTVGFGPEAGRRDRAAREVSAPENG